MRKRRNTFIVNAHRPIMDSIPDGNKAVFIIVWTLSGIGIAVIASALIWCTF